VSVGQQGGKKWKGGNLQITGDPLTEQKKNDIAIRKRESRWGLQKGIEMMERGGWTFERPINSFHGLYQKER